MYKIIHGYYHNHKAYLAKCLLGPTKKKGLMKVKNEWNGPYKCQNEKNLLLKKIKSAMA